MTSTQQQTASPFGAVPDGDALLARFREALRLHSEAEEAIRQKSADLDRVRREVDAATAGRTKLTQSFSQKAAAALASGENLPDPSEADLRRIRKFNQTIASAEGAFEVLAAKEAAAADKVSATRLDLANATIELLQAVRDFHALRIRAAISSVLPSIALLSATDAVQSSLIGLQGYDGRLHSRTFGGDWVAKALAKALPPQVRPPELAPDDLDRASSRVAAEMIATLKEKSQ